MILVLDKAGFSLGRRGRGLVVRFRGGDKKFVSVVDLDEVVISANGSISTEAIRLLSSYGVPVVFSGRFSPYAVVHSFFAHGTVLVRRAQMEALGDGRGVLLAKAFVFGATKNKERVLRYFAKGRRDVSGDLLDAADRIASVLDEIKGLEGDRIDSVRSRLMGLEGEAANIYYGAFRLLFNDELGFRGRERRPPRDPVNALLSFGYTILNSLCSLAIAKVGLEPFAGFLHVDRSGRPSLVLDLSEEFRQPIVDVVVVRLFSKRGLSADDFVCGDDGCFLGGDGKKVFFEEFNSRLGKMVSWAGSRRSFRGAIMFQARQVVRFLLGIIPRYRPFVWRW